jgi:uncharacterized protein
MTVEIKLVGHRCNLACAYCYEQHDRRERIPLDKAAMFRQIDRLGGSFHLFGGEPLLSSLAELEEFFAYGHQKFGHSGIQTNGTLITPAHIVLFQRYCVGVGVSIDGPGDLNAARCGVQQTAKTEAAIDALLEAGVVPSFIITLSAANVGTSERVARFLEWVRGLRHRGIRHINPHLLERHGPPELVLPDSDLMSVLDALWALQDESPDLTLSIFSDVLRVLQGQDDHVLCHHRSCDPWNTPSCNGIEPDGEPSMCGRVLTGGPWTPADGHSYERQLALEVTPQDHGGCQGCPYWICCTGACPGGAIDGDWRNKDAYCAVWKHLYAEGERRLRRAGIVPVTQHPHRALYERYMHEAWARGDTPRLSDAVLGSSCGTRRAPRDGGHGDGHGDHTDHTRPRHGDSGHGDSPHGDSHGDSGR